MSTVRPPYRGIEYFDKSVLNVNRQIPTGPLTSPPSPSLSQLTPAHSAVVKFKVLFKIRLIADNRRSSRGGQRHAKPGIKTSCRKSLMQWAHPGAVRRHLADLLGSPARGDARLWGTLGTVEQSSQHVLVVEWSTLRDCKPEVRGSTLLQPVRYFSITWMFTYMYL